MNPKDWENTSHAYGLDHASFDLDAPNKRILAFCDQLHIDCLDLLSLLRQAVGRHLFFPRGDMHLNKSGQRIVAEGMKGYILQSYLAH